MNGEISPPKTTGGEGFVFENDVCAYYLAVMLLGRPPLAPIPGALSRIDFQTRAGGWLVDDALLTIEQQGDPCGPVPTFVEKARRAYSPGAFSTRPPGNSGGQTEEEYAHGAVYAESPREESAI